jgi:histidine ammonia-lyase
MSMHIVVGPSGTSFDDVVAVARHGARVELSAAAHAAMAAARRVIDDLAARPEPVYGVSTGFGALAVRHIEPALRARLQRNIVRSHAAGMGPPVEREVVRALMFLRLKTLASGHTGVRPEIAATMAAVLNAGITPVVHAYGSLGCSGDLAPLAHCALTLLGEGDASGPDDGPPRPAAELLAAYGIAPVELREKEGLALLNGTDGMLGMLVLACADLGRLFTAADITAALTLEALLGTDRVLAPGLHALRPHPGQAASAANMRRMLAGSGLTGHHQDDAPRVQDAYSVRCAPQVAGAGRDTLAHARAVGERELAAAVDNPVVIGDRVESNGNFHGAPVGYVLDFLAIAVADLASIAERRTDRLLDRNRSHGLPPFLAGDAGVDSGLMIAQYTQAALVGELKRLAVPASTDSIPSSAMQEDHVSMGWSAARKLRTAVDGLTRVLAVELYAAARAVELRDGLGAGPRPGPAARSVIAAARAAGVGGPGEDRRLAPELAAAEEFVRSGALIAAAESVTGPLL